MQFNINNQQGQQGQQQMGDMEMMNDSIASQKLISSTYDVYANECATPNLRDEFLNIFKDEHQIQADIFTEMQKRGWYQIKPADQQQVTQAKQKYQNMLG
ncbi:MAG TPA: spore coat protein [Clostridia bacterium]|nr:spore coat protein [Clostridia bacterium]